jgi:hypothetical protein
MTSPKIDLQVFKDYWKRLETCCFQHPKDFDLDNVVEVLHWEQSIPDGEHGLAVARMKDSRFAVFSEWQDYTGHG